MTEITPTRAEPIIWERVNKKKGLPALPWLEKVPLDPAICLLSMYLIVSGSSFHIIQVYFKLLPLYWNLEQVTLYMSLSREESQFLTARCGGGGGGTSTMVTSLLLVDHWMGMWDFLMSIFIMYLTVLVLSWSMWDPVPWPGIEPGPPALAVQSFSQQTIREVPGCKFW